MIADQGSRSRQARGTERFQRVQRQGSVHLLEGQFRPERLTDFNHGLWVTVGTAAGTIRLLASAPARAHGLMNFGSKEALWATKNRGAYTPWVTDGTVAGMVQLSTTAILGEDDDWAIPGATALFSGDPGGFDGTES